MCSSVSLTQNLTQNMRLKMTKVCHNSINRSSIVRECLSCALSNSNTAIGYKLAFYIKNLNIIILEHDLKYCLEPVKPEPLNIKYNHLYNVYMNYHWLNVVN